MAAQTFTYSFLDTKAGIVGPGGAFSLGSGAGIAEEGISVEPSEDIDAMTIGADGSAMHSLVVNKSGKITIRLLKTSPTNQALMNMLAVQRAASANFGQNTISIANTASGDIITCQQVAFARVPTINYAKNGGMNEWHFNAGVIDLGLGAGVN